MSSAHSSPRKQAQQSLAQHPESPIVPPQQSDRINAPQLVNMTTFDKMTTDAPAPPKPQGSRAQVKTPEPLLYSKDRMNGHKEATERSPSTPGHLAPFDWEEFEARYEDALADANRQEQELLEEFERLVKYFNVWAAAASVHDTERGIKRLQTRERYVKIAEQSLSQKKKHCESHHRLSIGRAGLTCHTVTEVVRAFQSALALLSQS
ncbi:hypothetical protein QBC46DRAFT_116735 [Diplogelasinospora grovesii]|uniref:Uncharacterized protein n=1 Tax=Diplogelasinospora grovesii TaxID=303347 RepID=A0AAN6SA21_9PEZI|nr:hypothetical protein QBC46DRAFT_116735 [Diplogelasinospora grovesii]